MMRVAVILSLLLAGCAQKGPRSAVAPEEVQTPSAQGPRYTGLSLEQIAPDARKVVSAAPATAPATQPSLDALEAFARGRGALAERQTYTAVDLLEKAARLDPTSAEVLYELGRAYSQAGRPQQAIEVIDRAAQLNPDWIDAYVDLGRLLSRTDPPRALRALICATHTRQYASSDADAAIVDFHLARMLQSAGHTSAAIAQYEKLLWRLSRRSLSIRGNADLAALAAHPEPLQLELARLYEREGDLPRAMALYTRIAEQAPAVFEPQARLVRAHLAAGQTESALKRAGDLVQKFDASPASVQLLREAHRAAGSERGVIDELRRLHRQNPADRNMLTALADALAADGRNDEAEALLAEAAAKTESNLDLIRKLCELYSDRDDTRAAARLLIQTTADRPALAGTLAPLWQPLIRPWRRNALRSEDLRQIQVSASAEPARLYWVARLAAESGRDAVARQALQRATEVEPLFAPAYLLRTQHIWLIGDVGSDEKERQTAELLVRARAAGEDELAAQIEALAAGYSMQSPADLPFFEKANVDHALPEFSLAYAAALGRASQAPKLEQLLWKVLSEHPLSEDSYRALLDHYNRQGAAGPATKVVTTWLQNDPRSPAARLGQAGVLARMRRFDAAEALLLELVQEDPTEEAALISIRELYLAGDRPGEAVELFERLRAADPGNGNALQVLVGLHVARGETPAALRVLESAEAASPQHANYLYFLAQLYYQVDEKPSAERLMERALAVDPGHVPSSNDLAYFWAEAGRNLSESERLARQAVNAEPDNSAYLDTLGWALYKQGRFDEARKYLEQAVSTASPVDPVLLDHLGDALYRLGDGESAARQWRRASDLLGMMRNSREDHARLKLEVQSKLRQRAENLPVDVSPVAEARVER